MCSAPDFPQIPTRASGLRHRAACACAVPDHVNTRMCAAGCPQARSGFSRAPACGPGRETATPVSRRRCDVLKGLERETGIEPATSSLGSSRSTAELLPLVGGEPQDMRRAARRRAEGILSHERINANTSSRFAAINSGVRASRFNRSSGSVLDGRTLKCQSGYSTDNPSNVVSCASR